MTHFPLAHYLITLAFLIAFIEGVVWLDKRNRS